MRVLQVMPGLGGGGGAERSAVAVAAALVESGVDLHLALLTDRRDLVGEIEAAGVTCWDLSGATGTVGRSRALERLVEAVEPDVVHATLFEAAIAAQLASLALRCRRRGRGAPPAVLVTWANTTYGPDHVDELAAGRSRLATRAKLGVLAAVEALLARCTRTHFHAVTEGVAAANAAALRLPRHRVHVAERGRTADRFVPPAVAPGATRAPLPADVAARGVSPDARVVVAVGRQEPQKGLDRLLDHFERLADADAAVWLVVAGREGSATPELERRRATMRHGDRVLFLGHRDDVADVLGAADVVVCASRREGAAGALIEAMACARPIVTVDLVGLAGVLDDGVNAVVVAPAQLSAAVAALLDDPARARRLGTAARRTFEERFTVERAGAAMAAVYGTVVASSGRRSKA